MKQQQDNSTRIDAALNRLEAAVNPQRRATMLRSLTVTLIALHLVALAIMAMPPPSDLFEFLIVGSSLLIYTVIYFQQRVGQVRLAAIAFCGFFNLFSATFYIINIFQWGATPPAALLGYISSLNVLLAGILIGTPAIFIFAVLNGIMLCVAPQLILHSGLRSTLVDTFPMLAFLTLLTIVSWLYQRTLHRADVQLDTARRQIMHDELLRHDMELARALQERLSPDPPQLDGRMAIRALSAPAHVASGDFYDFIELGDERIGVVMADVTGKSVAAAMVMAMVRSILRSEAIRYRSPAEVLRAANQTLWRDRAIKQLVTIFYGILDTHNLTLTCANAGHPFPTLKRAGKLEEIELVGFPLGARPDTIYVERVIGFQPGDQFILISDGVVEEMNAQREIFGFERLAAVFARSRDGAQLLDETMQAITTFRGEVSQSDDITMMVFDFAQGSETPPGGPATFFTPDPLSPTSPPEVRVVNAG